MFTLWITGNFPVKVHRKLRRVGTLKFCTAPTVKYTKCYMPGFYQVLYSIFSILPQYLFSVSFGAGRAERLFGKIWF